MYCGDRLFLDNIQADMSIGVASRSPQKASLRDLCSAGFAREMCFTPAGSGPVLHHTRIIVIHLDLVRAVERWHGDTPLRPSQMQRRIPRHYITPKRRHSRGTAAPRPASGRKKGVDTARCGRTSPVEMYSNICAINSGCIAADGVSGACRSRFLRPVDAGP
ncbi:hypothetical protein EVAR_44745_1 [Eumeta japonica]|uniref:Uncharacterized protein n=1 Tax=Eumeta variegata TaxID=151549 RepID=A0A4C1XJW9_EUMVA|nr:hypothetical protein EVAR_44745_1 [Eumeta japonica]